MSEVTSGTVYETVFSNAVRYDNSPMYPSFETTATNTVAIYGSNKRVKPANISEMTKIEERTSPSIYPITTKFRYIAFDFADNNVRTLGVIKA